MRHYKRIFENNCFNAYDTKIFKFLKLLENYYSPFVIYTKENKYLCEQSMFNFASGYKIIIRYE